MVRRGGVHGNDRRGAGVSGQCTARHAASGCNGRGTGPQTRRRHDARREFADGWSSSESCARSIARAFHRGVRGACRAHDQSSCTSGRRAWSAFNAAVPEYRSRPRGRTLPGARWTVSHPRGRGPTNAPLHTGRSRRLRRRVGRRLGAALPRGLRARRVSLHPRPAPRSTIQHP